MAQKKEPIKDLRTTLLSRGLSLARASLRAGTLAAGQFLNSDGSKSNAAWLGKVDLLVEELGKLKGTAMKVGQTLSIYGEHLLPKEVNELLKSLQQDSPPLAWENIRKVLVSELGEEKLALLEIETVPVASASIGQVHRAKIKATGQDLALKIQYPGVAEAVDTDLKLLKFILNMSELVPRGPRFDQIFTEIREMFLQEINYTIEFKHAQNFRQRLQDDPRFIVPGVHQEFSTRRVIAYDFIEGSRPDSPEVQALPLERRNRLGLAFLDLYLRELLEFREMQTDPHLGNYRIQIDDAGNDKLVLFDFGAVREVPENFLRSYFSVMEGGITGNSRLIEKGGRNLGLLQPEDSLELVDDYIKLAVLIIEPFEEKAGDYDWGQSDLPKRVATAATKIATSYQLRAPPRELIFLDRKLGGVFIFMSVMKCQLAARNRILTAIEKFGPVIK